MNAISELEGIVAYLEEHWTERELTNFSRELDHTVELISRNPELFQASSARKDIRRAVIAKYTNLYYRMGENTVVILSLFSNRQHPDKLKL
ncbi:type II toxin-antitoxin system RelE/ParE family toxin [Flagellimonas marinaquae]|uniref:type II toxin-antitoxin system RelE/ParE family toxin n=1 Tax=Flagellimonas marinaquae TaxID=254955 RepID=UPI0021CFD437|nr:type II toxin-antitoxin system RelE/ParE family toxin [Allomuricauda aquimarina]